MCIRFPWTLRVFKGTALGKSLSGPRTVGMRLMMSQPVRQQLCHPWAHHLWRKKKSILCHIFHLGLGASIVFGERQKQWSMWELIIQRNKFQLSLLITVLWIRKMILLSPKIPNRNIHLFLVVRDRWTRMVFCTRVTLQRSSERPSWIQMSFEWFPKLGYPKMIVRYDPEPALQAVVEAAKNGFQGQLILEKIPVGVSESKGEIERAVQTIEGQSRTLRSALETSYGSKIGDDSVILTWLVEHAGTLHNLFHRSGEMKDGKTPYSRHRGREWRVSIPPFGETVEFLKRGHKFESRWHEGIFLRVKDNTTEKIVGNGSGVFTVQSIRRKSGDDKYNLEILQSVTGVPWDPQATRDDVPEGPRPAIVVGEPAEPLAQPVVVQAPKPKTSRRLYITKRDLEKYGYTAGCPACDGVQIGNRSTGVHHNDVSWENGRVP